MAFHTKVEELEYSSKVNENDNKIAHARMKIHGQTVFLNDRFGNKEKSLDCFVHLILTFKTPEELLDCYEKLKEGGSTLDPFEEAPYSKLCGNFMDKFGVLWGFMADA